MLHGHGAPFKESPSVVHDERNIDDACPVCSSSGVVAEESGERSRFVYYVGPKKGKHGPVCIRVKKSLLLDEEVEEGQEGEEGGCSSIEEGKRKCSLYCFKEVANDGPPLWRVRGY